MTNQQNIFKRLADYEVQPPAEVLSLIINALDSDREDSSVKVCGSLIRLQEISIQPPFDSYELVAGKINQTSKFFALQDAEVTPPPFFEKIMGKIKSDKDRGASTGSVIKKLASFRIQAAAAIILLLTGGWLLYKTLTGPGNTITPDVVKKEQPIAPLTKDTSSKLVITKSDKVITPKIPAVAYSGKASIMIGEDEVKVNVIDNDLLATFANFSFNTVPAFLRNEKDEPFVIRLDQYTAVAVSESMGGMMKKMNSFRKNGKLTNKAKRERKRLERWKKADEKRFDNSFNKNPLDPLDLGEFVFN